MRFLSDYLQRRRANAQPSDPTPAAKRSPLLDMLPRDKLSDFGRQVLMQMALTPDEFSFSKDVRSMYHMDLGMFVVKDDGAVVQEGSVSEFGEYRAHSQRALTAADQAKIVQEMVTLLQRPVPVSTNKGAAQMQAAPATATYMQTMQDARNQQLMQAMQEMQVHQVSAAVREQAARHMLDISQSIACPPVVDPLTFRR